MAVTPDRAVFSLLELNEHLKRVIAFNMREALWIRCELADVGNSKGSIYLSLVERSDFKVSARAEAIIWGRTLKELQQRIGDSLWSILQPGRQVLVQVETEYHEYFGMKLHIKDLDPSVTIGQVELQRAQTLKKLEQEQFTQLNAQVPTPRVWQRIAVISSSTAAGLQDFLQQLQQNSYGYQFKYELFQAVVQGVHVAEEVRQALVAIEARRAEFDCVVIVRGGGARLDLMGFDHYDLCVAVATCELPVITGIGHDIDETLADLVAHTSLKTPTAVAEYLVQRAADYEATLTDYQLRLQRLALEYIHIQQLVVERLETQLQQVVEQRLAQAHQDLEQWSDKLHLLDPQTILNRGFALLTDTEGTPIYNRDQLKTGASYTLRLADGTVQIVLAP